MKTAKNTKSVAKKQELDDKKRKNAEYQKKHKQKSRLIANGVKSRLDIILDGYTAQSLSMLVSNAQGETKKDLIQRLINAEFERLYPMLVKSQKKQVEKTEKIVEKVLNEQLKKEILHGKRRKGTKQIDLVDEVVLEK
ncbi:hypothetical protein ACWIW6_10785 [Ursidibacter sp. B-7004-1]